MISKHAHKLTVMTAHERDKSFGKAEKIYFKRWEFVNFRLIKFEKKLTFSLNNSELYLK